MPLPLPRLRGWRGTARQGEDPDPEEIEALQNEDEVDNMMVAEVRALE